MCTPTAPKPWIKTVSLSGGGTCKSANCGRLLRRGISSRRAQEGDHDAAGGGAQLIDAITAHVNRLGNGSIQAVFDSDRFHVGVIGANVGARQIQVAVVVDAGERNDALPRCARPVTGHDRRRCRFAAAVGQVGGRILEGHAARQVVDDDGVRSGSMRMPPIEGRPMARLSTTR